MQFKINRTEPREILAVDGNFGQGAPWFMYRDYHNHPNYLEIPDDLKPLADRFMRDGFLILENSIDIDLCDEVVAAFNAFTARHAVYFDKFRDRTGFLHRVENLHVVMPELMKVFSRSVDNLRFQDAAFGRPTAVYTSLYFERGSTQNIHRDTPYFCTRPEFQYFGTWFAFEDANLDNGCLEVIRGGHLVAEIDRAAFAVKLYGSPENVPAIPQNLWDQYQSSVSELCGQFDLYKESIQIKKGSTLIWHPQLPHGGGPIRKPGLIRHSLVMHTVPANTPVYQANAFFNPTRVLPETANWKVNSYENRMYVVHPNINVMHLDARPTDSFLK